MSASGRMSVDSSPEADRSSPAVGFRTDAATGSTFLDQADLRNLPGLRHLGTTRLRPRLGTRFIETIDDYADLFQELQIDPTFRNVFWSSVIYRYRQGTRHLPLLRRGTGASIKTMSDDILRAYGQRIWGPKSEWRSGLATGEVMLLHEKDGANTKLYEILEKLWWRMRELVFEEKPARKRRGRARNQTTRGAALQQGDEKDGPDIDNNAPLETDSETPTPASVMARKKAKAKVSELTDRLPSPAPGEFLTFQQSEDEIIDLIGRLHHLRLASDPDVFERLWAAHIGRAEEIETPIEPTEIVRMGHLFDEKGNPLHHPGADQPGDEDIDEDIDMEHETIATASGPITSPRIQDLATSSAVAAVPFPVQLVSDEDIRKRVYPNYSSEPFNSSGNAIPVSMTQKHRLPPTLPRVMSIWIMTSPPHASYPSRAYHHPAAPVQEQDMVSFFTHVMDRAEHVAAEDVKGYAFSYGWCDVSRWVEKTIGTGCGGEGDGKVAGESEGERRGWSVFQKDLLDAANAGVMIWRMKVLVVKQ